MINTRANIAFFSFLSDLAPNNKNLVANSYYTLFIRVNVTNNLYTSTSWYSVVLTSGGKNNGNKKAITKDEEKCKLSLGSSHPETLGNIHSGVLFL